MLLVSRVDPSGLLCAQVDKASFARPTIPVVAWASLRDARQRCNYTRVYAASRTPMPAPARVQLTEANAAFPQDVNMDLVRDSYTVCIILSET